MNETALGSDRIIQSEAAAVYGVNYQDGHALWQPRSGSYRPLPRNARSPPAEAQTADDVCVANSKQARPYCPLAATVRTRLTRWRRARRRRVLGAAIAPGTYGGRYLTDSMVKMAAPGRQRWL